MASPNNTPSAQRSAGSESDASIMSKPVDVPPMITSTSKDAAHLAAVTYKSAFATDPLLRWLSTPSSASSPSLLDVPGVPYRLWHIMTSQTISNGGIITNVDGDWNSVGIYFVPGHANDSMAGLIFSDMLPTFAQVLWAMGAKRAWRAAVTLPLMQDRLKADYFRPERVKHHDFYYVAFLATLESCRGQGLGSNWIRWMQAKATEEGKPIWLETTTLRAKAMYERCGFKTVGMEVLGQGEVDEDGLRVTKGVEGGAHEAIGVRLWGLVWWPPGMKEERKQTVEVL